MADDKPRPPKGNRLSRRQFLAGAGTLVGGAAIGSALGGCRSTIRDSVTPTGDEIIYSPDTQRDDRIPPGQSETGRWPVLQYGGVVHVSQDDWKFTISGLVDAPVVLSYAQFVELPGVRVFSDVHCVTGWSKLNNLWQGSGSQTIFDLAKARPEAKFVIVKAEGGFTANLTLEDFLEEDVVFAVSHDDQPLTSEHGAPVRLVVPRLYFWKSAKWVNGIEFTDVDRPGFWELAGYNNHGDPWKEERYQGD